MPSLTFRLYDVFRRKQMSGNGAVDIASATVKLMLVTVGYAPNQNTHDFRDDLGANEVVGSNYTAGGATLANCSVTLDAAGLITIDFDDPPIWGEHASGFTDARRAVAYVARGGAASADELIGYTEDFGGGRGNVAGDFTLQLDPDGLYKAPR